ncbi:mantle protein-like isoform X1 [Anopheles merus]|uniref:mantle protein-like isoform X1 n=1 Tax=Anopheles merus TaxID=30066 RepID=UPI001BE3DEB2|nr:mantle protein-like isoform X1 [Anopheles merus]
MKAFIVFTMALALASAKAVENSNKEKRGLWDLGSAQHESYESYGYDHQQSHGYYGNDYAEKEEKQIITKKVPVPYPVEVEKHVPVEVKVPYPVEVEKKVPVVVEKKVPVYVEKKYPVHVDRPYPVEVKYPVHVPVYQKEYVEVPKPYEVHVDKPYPVYVKEPVYVEKPVPFTVLIKKEHKKPFFG